MKKEMSGASPNVIVEKASGKISEKNDVIKITVTN